MFADPLFVNHRATGAFKCLPLQIKISWSLVDRMHSRSSFDQQMKETYKMRRVLRRFEPNSTASQGAALRWHENDR